MRNLILITADDMSYQYFSSDFPALHQLSSNSVWFTQAHTNAPFCQPSRALMMTGLYPQHSGCTSFNPVNVGVQSLTTILKNAGYFTAIMGKVHHYDPPSVFPWDNLVADGCKTPVLQQYSVVTFLQQAVGKSFFISLNSEDPHRAFNAPLVFHPELVELPPYLPDTPFIRADYAAYLSSVYRFDNMLGRILETLDDFQQQDNTLVVVTSDHGHSFPFAKANCSPYGTHIPLAYRCPGSLTPCVNLSMVSHVDMMPTILDLIGITTPGNIDGSSYASVITGGTQDRLNYVYSQVNNTANGKPIMQRGLLRPDAYYVYNSVQDYPGYDIDGWGWADTVNALKVDQTRFDQFFHRPEEEFHGLGTTLTGPLRVQRYNEMKLQLSTLMRKYNDSLTLQLD